MERAALARRWAQVPGKNHGTSALGDLWRRSGGVSEPGRRVHARGGGPLQGAHAERRHAPHARPAAAHRGAGRPAGRLGGRTAAMSRAFAFLCVVLAGPAWAQAYPERPVHLLLTFASGGQADILARLVTDRMRESLGQPIIVEPKPGAGGNLAMEATA